MGNPKNKRIISSHTPIIAFLLLPNKLLYVLYRWTIAWSRTKYARLSLFLIAFSESSFFPVPPDVLLIAMSVAERKKWWIFAGIATAGSIAGAILGYYIGYALYESVGRPIISFYHLQEYFDYVGRRYQENASLAIFTAAFTPIPFKVFTLAGGLFKISLTELLIGSIFGRAGRFFTVAFAIRIFGKQIERVIEKYFNILSIIFAILLIGGFIILRYL